MKVDDIISYSDIVSEEGQNIQKGMNFKTRFGYSILLMSVRKERSLRGSAGREHQFDSI